MIGVSKFAKYEIRKRKGKDSKTCPHFSPDSSCEWEEIRVRIILFLQKNSLPY
jgi:hypothetical protein